MSDPVRLPMQFMVREAKVRASVWPLAQRFNIEVLQAGLKKVFEDGGQELLAKQFGDTKVEISKNAARPFIHVTLRNELRRAEFKMSGGKVSDCGRQNVAVVLECNGNPDDIRAMVDEVITVFKTAQPS